MSETEPYDAIVIGAGSAGVACATALAQGGLARVAAIERERVGGECAYWACVPSKVLLRSEDPSFESARVPGSKASRTAPPDFAQAAAWRTSMVDDYRDTDHAAALGKAGVALMRGEASIVGPGVVRFEASDLRARTIVVATGSEPDVPPIEGLAGRPFWTSRDATSAGSVPPRLMMLGGGAVGVELAQVFARYGSQVTIADPAPHLLAEDEPRAAELITEALERDGVHVLAGAHATLVGWNESGSVTVSFKNGAPVEVDRICVATGRTTRSKHLGLERAGASIDEHGCITIDEQCRAAEGLYAIGDVTGKAMFTHVAKYQARIAAAAILGRPARARYDAIPRCLYTSPELAAVGVTRAQAERAGIRVREEVVAFDEITRPTLHYDDSAQGAIGMLADADRNRIIGGWIVGPAASEMVAFISTAIRTQASYEALLDVIQPYPTFSEAFYVALDRLARA